MLLIMSSIKSAWSVHAVQHGVKSTLGTDVGGGRVHTALICRARPSAVHGFFVMMKRNPHLCVKIHSERVGVKPVLVSRWAWQADGGIVSYIAKTVGQVLRV